MAQKTRSQLKTQSDNTFQDAPPANITPENHRIWNDDAVDSMANLEDLNTFKNNNTFEGGIISTVADGIDALFSADGDIFLQGGDLDVGGQTNLNATFVRTLQNAFSNITYSATNTLLDLTNAEGNIIYIVDDGEINTWLGVQGRIYYAIHTGTVTWNVSGGDVQPTNNFKMFGDDIVIFMFVTANSIRIIGTHRGYGAYGNGQNYFSLPLPQDALDLASYGLLDTGATYRVINAIELPKASGIFWDVYLTARDNSTLEETCYLRSNDVTGTAQKAWFTGSFGDDSILITDRLDTTVDLTWLQAETNFALGSKYAKDGAQTFVNDNDYGFSGYVFHNEGGKTQTYNILDIKNTGNQIGSLYNCLDPLSNIVRQWVPNSGSTSDGLFGANFWLLPVPSIGQINALMTAQGIACGITSFYNCCYQVVNRVCTVHFRADVSGRFNGGASGHELRLLLPLPFNADASIPAGYGYGSLRNLTDGNHEDIGVLVDVFSDNYLIASSKWSTSTTVKNCIISGCFVYPVVNQDA